MENTSCRDIAAFQVEKMRSRFPVKIKAGLKVLSAMALHKAYGKRTPLWANLFITNKCNLNCLYCFVDVNDRTVVDFTLAQIFSMIDALHDLGTVVICLLGGEPLLRNDLDEIVAYIQSKAMLCEVNTNGVRFRRHLKTLRKVDSVCISIDGDAYHHDLNRGKGSYKTAVAAIKMAKENQIPLRLHTTVTKNNIPSLGHVVDLAKQYDAKLNCAIAAVPANRENTALKFNNEEIRDFYQKIKAFKKKGFPISNAQSTLDYLINWPAAFDFLAYDEKEIPGGVEIYDCKRKAFTCYIDANGGMYPCATIWKKENVANVLDVGVKRAWEEIQHLKCRFCITEVEVNMLFNARLSSLWNLFSYMVVDHLLKRSGKRRS